MALSQSSALHHWSAYYGEVPAFGGYPTFTRNTAGKIVDRSGKPISALPNRLRASWEMLGGAPPKRPTFLLEPGRTNSFTYSEQLGNAAWTTAGINAVRSDSTIAPDGNLTADLIEESTANSEHNIEPTTFPTCTANTLQSWSVFAKARERTFLRMSTVNKANTVVHSWANLSTGAFGTVGAGHTVQVAALGNGWYRFSVTFDSGTGATTMRAVCATATADAGPFTFVGVAGAGLWLWGMQFEVDQKCPSSYIATTNVAASRGADVLNWSFTPAPQAMMGYVRFIESGTIKMGGTVLMSISDSANSTPELLIYNSGSVYTLYHHNGSAAVTSSLAAAGVVGDTVELLPILYSDGSVELVQSINGAAVTSGGRSAANALATAWADQKLWLNSSGTGFNGVNKSADLRLGKYADVVASSAQGRMDEFRAWEYDAQGNAL